VTLAGGVHQPHQAWQSDAGDRAGPRRCAADGNDINRTIAATFFIGALLAGAGGMIWGLYYNTVYYQLGSEAG